MNINDIRKSFREYFKGNEHQVVSSSSVVPHEDPTLLFINAGMNQFKDVFLGKSRRDYVRATTCQKCLRVGGKHNDLENVGHTKRHLTFFEMLGNFSFGDYFKKEAIRYAWEYSVDILQFPPEKLWASVFRDDDEAYELWKPYLPEARIVRLDEKDNFWAMGDVGPCGPCTELLYDRGEAYGSCTSPVHDEDGERFLEYWNLVFMQYNRSESGEMVPLPKPSVDTGAGLERIANLVMGVDSVFETDIFRTIIAQVEEISGIEYDYHDTERAPAFHVIADHLRALSFAIADGAQPSNVDRGYVLRKILRRAVRYGRTLGMKEPFLARVFPRLLDTMGDDYQELGSCQDRIVEILTCEEEAFIRTLKRGGNILNTVIEKAKNEKSEISGDDAFKLKDTYGFPLEEIALIAKDLDLQVDIARFSQLEEEARERSRSAQKKVEQHVEDDTLYANIVEENGETAFVGYHDLVGEGMIVAIVKDGKSVDSLEEGEEGVVILDRTNFYAEMGGQVSDTGVINAGNGVVQVSHCHAPYKGVVGHVATAVSGMVSVGDKVEAHVDKELRQRIMANHTATHLLHWALCEVLGEHVKQSGSIVEPERLRFDFSHHKALSEENIHHVEDLVNAKIRTNTIVEAHEIAYEEAQKSKDIKQFFGDKYDSLVRVVDIDFSKELCGGTHIKNLGEIGYFRIMKEGSIAAGIRRIEGVTGHDAETFARQCDNKINTMAAMLKVHPQKVLTRVEKLLNEKAQLVDELKDVRKGQLQSVVDTVVAKKENVSGIDVIIADLALEPKEVKAVADVVMAIVTSGVLLLGNVSGDRCQLIIRVSHDIVQKGIRAHEIIAVVAPFIGGGGGGKSHAAQAGGDNPAGLKEAFEKTKELLQRQC